MGRGFRLLFCRMIPYFQSCRSKHPSNLPQDPVPKSSLHFEPNNRRRTSFQHNIPSTFFSQLANSKRHSSSSSSTSSDILGFNCQNCDIVSDNDNNDDTAPRRKIYNSAASDDDNNNIEEKKKQKHKQRIKRKSTTRRRRSFRMSTSSVDSGFFYRTEFEFDEEEGKEEKQREEDCRETTPARLSVFIKRSVVRCGAAKKKKKVVAEGKVRESFAVMKKSEEPYEDFKRSMIEMILDKEMFDKVELEQLLACFLSLNSSKYHGIIVQAFSDIWVSLFNL